MCHLDPDPTPLTLRVPCFGFPSVCLDSRLRKEFIPWSVRSGIRIGTVCQTRRRGRSGSPLDSLKSSLNSEVSSRLVVGCPTHNSNTSGVRVPTPLPPSPSDSKDPLIPKIGPSEWTGEVRTGRTEEDGPKRTNVG